MVVYRPGCRRRQLLLLCVMDHALHNNKEDAIATMTHVRCGTKRPILSLRKSILWFSSVRLLPIADIHVNSSDGSTRLKADTRLAFVVQLQRWLTSTTLLEQYAEEIGEESLDVVRVLAG